MFNIKTQKLVNCKGSFTHNQRNQFRYREESGQIVFIIENEEKSEGKYKSPSYSCSKPKIISIEELQIEIEKSLVISKNEKAVSELITYQKYDLEIEDKNDKGELKTIFMYVSFNKNENVNILSVLGQYKCIDIRENNIDEFKHNIEYYREKIIA